MTTRRYAAIAGTALITIALAACGDGQDTTDPTTTTPTTTVETTSSTTPTTPPDTTEAATPVEPEPAPVEEAPAEQPEAVEPESIWAPPGQGYQCPRTDAFVWDPADCTPENLGAGTNYAQEEGNATEQFWRDNPHLLDQPLGGDPSTWTYDGPRTENGDPEDHPQLNWPSD